MGNVLAHSPPNPAMSVPLSPPVASKDDAGHGVTPIEETTTQEIKNPGTMEEIHKQCTDLSPMVFEGGKFIVNKGLSNHLQVSHTINLSSIQPSGYRFGATYIGTQVSPTEAYPVLVGDIDPSGNLNAHILHQFTPKLKSKFIAQIDSGTWQVTQLTTDYKTNNSTSSLTLGNLDLINRSGLGVAHYLQQVTRKLCLGSELAYQFGDHIPGGHIAVHSVAAKYTGSDFTASGTLGGAGVHLCYHQKCTDQMQVGVELETSLRMQESVATTAFQIEMPKANASFKGKLDSNLTVGCVFEKKLHPMPFTLALSAMHSHSKNKFKLGLGFFIG